jgi:hypothetical protein
MIINMNDQRKIIHRKSLSACEQPEDLILLIIDVINKLN